MELSSDLISQFVKTTKDDNKTNTGTTAYGTVHVSNGVTYVKLDGSDLLTPISTTASVQNLDRVIVTIKDHKATITGNVSDPSGSSIALGNLGTQVGNFSTVLANQAVFNNLIATQAQIDALTAGNLTVVGRIVAAEAGITNLEADNIVINQGLTAAAANIETLQANYANIGNLSANYAQIDFANIGEAALRKIFANTGIIGSMVVQNGTITGELVGVTISGDRIIGNTIIADKLVLRGDDGLFYKLNTDGLTQADITSLTNAVTATELKNNLHGSKIIANSITAEKIDVSDLVAFNATIGGFNIGDASLYSGVKSSISNTTRGIYMDTTGQMYIGDATNYLKYYYDSATNSYKLSIAASEADIDLTDELSAVYNEMAKTSEYVRVTKYFDTDSNNQQPCVELGESDSDFKLRATNTGVDFMDGTNIPTSVTNKGVTSDNITVKNELSQGGFVWKARANGNYGLIWKGAN